MTSPAPTARTSAASAVHAPPRHALTLDDLQARRAAASRWAIGGMALIVGLGLNLPGRRVRFEVEGADRLPDHPVIFACNHTHRLDWIVLRWLGYLRGRAQCNWVKPRTYEEGWSAFLDRTGNVPLASRGYLISADFRALFARAPSEGEYRALRDHLDRGEALPDEPVFHELTTRSRDILGVRFDATHRTWRETVEELFAAMMAATVRHTQRLMGDGHDLTIMPQGATSMRLTRGHPGAVQAALALGAPLVPVGISGFPQAFGDSESLPRHGGTVIVRFGGAWHPPAIPDLQPFVPASERAHREALDERTAALMDRIAGLVEPEHGWAEDLDDTDVKGVSRFV